MAATTATCPADCHYFQVYGPVEPIEKVTNAAKKLANDFATIVAHWGKTNQIKAYSFVFNAKYEGVFRDLAQALADLERANPSVKCRPVTAGQLEDIFMGLDEDAMVGVLNAPIPDPRSIANLQYDVLTDVVRYILATPATPSVTRFGELPDLDEKIRLNRLSSPWADVIRAAARQVGHVDAYFAKNSRFARQELRDHMVSQYRHASEWAKTQPKLPDSLRDAVFVEFRQRLTPRDASLAVANAVDILIGYYFEACDVFDPFATEEPPDAAP